MRNTMSLNDGWQFARLADTPGIRDTENLVERIGVDIALGRLQKAELAIAVFDLSEPLSAEDGRILQELSEREIPTVAVLNKNDLPPVWDPSVISARFPHTLTLSAGGSEADQESALSALNREIASLLSLSGFDPNEAMLANERQRACAAEAAELLSDVCGTIEAGYTLDAVDVALESALSALFRLILTQLGRSGRETKLSEQFQPRAGVVPDQAGPLWQKRIVFAGVFQSGKAAMQMAVDAGALLRETVSAKTDFLVLAPSAADGAKARAAAALNQAGKAHITFLDEASFLRMVRQ